MLTAPQIRAKRLAKLGGNGSRPNSTPPAQAGSPSSSAAATPASTPAQTPAETPAQKATPPPAAEPPQQNPFTQLGMTSENKPPPRINIKSQGVAPPASPKPQEFNIDVWADQVLGSIFRLTLDPNRNRDANGRPLYFVAGVKGDLEEENKPLRLSTDILDQAILESASSQSAGKPLEYLLACWKRTSILFRNMHNKQDPKYAVLREARRLCFNYCIFAATMPDMFGEDASSAVCPLAEYLLADPESDRGLCHEFLNEAVSRFSDPENGEEVKRVLVEAMEALSRQLAKLTMNDDYKPYIHAMRNFVRYPALLAALSQSELFLPQGIEAQDIETKTLLGPFFRLSPMQGEVALNYFANASTRDKGYIVNSQKALRMTLQTHQDELFDVANCFVKSSKESREKILDWFALSMNLNHKRRAIQSDPKTLSSDGFMVNVTVILDRLCEPFMDASFSKIDRIDINYLRRSPRVDIADETKLNADQQASDAFYANKADGANNFISEVFFLTVAAHHYGTEAANTKMSQLAKDINWYQKQLAKMELERHKFISNPIQLVMFEKSVKKLKDRIEQGQCIIHAIRGVLLDETTQARSMQFMRYVIVWLLRLVSGGTYPQKPLHLPLPEEEPMAFKCLPEYFVEDIVDNFKFITQHMPHIITSTQCEELVMICITFLRSSEYIKNPYLKSGLVSILCYGVWPFDRRSKGVLGDVLFAHKFATKHLLHALMKFYIECETAGASAFYNKFNIRYEIFQVVKCIWPNTIYRENLATEAQYELSIFTNSDTRLTIVV
jgi:ubiquitin conjugation factor E4 B